MAFHLLPPAPPRSGSHPFVPDFAPKSPSVLSLFITRLVSLLFLITFISVSPADAAFINFDNCLSKGTINSHPKRLQFVPYFVDAKFNSTDGINNLNITVYGNVTGQTFQGKLPAINSPDWLNPAKIDGKIIDLDPNTNILTTLFADVKVLGYDAWKPDQGFRFCEQVVNQPCPLIPSFNANGSDIAELSGFTVAHSFYSTYAMSTLNAHLSIQSGQDSKAMAPYLACVIAHVTPALGSTLSSVLTFIPVAIITVVALSTILAAWLSPWSSPDIYRWSSNYGRDADIIRLVTPGFSDCLNYLQFAVLSGALSLRYPGFFQPVVSRSSWSVLMFNQSLASGSPGISSVQDDVYIVNATRGLSGLRHHVGMAEDKDVWTGMIVWLCSIIGLVAILSLVGVALRWIHMELTRTGDVDRQNKSIPFMLGNLVRAVFNCFFLPIVTITMFQFVVANASPAVITAMAVVVLLIVLFLAAWLLRIIFTTRPRAHLFDYLPDLLLYGSLYNTYTDDAAAFAAVPLIVNVLRGIAIGAMQPSGIAQLVLLVICEIIFLMALHAFRPYMPSASMHVHHTATATVRLLVVFLLIAFVPALNVSSAVKGWVGYTILLLHALVFVFWYFLNALQTLLEVFARLGGAGGDARGGLSKVFGVKELSKRRHRSLPQNRHSARSILPDEHRRSMIDEHVRNSSLATGALLQQTHLPSADRSSHGGEPISPGQSTPGGSQSPFSFFSGQAPNAHAPAPSVGTASSMKAASANGRPSYIEPIDPYYRPPRPKRLTAGSEARRESSTSQPNDLRNSNAPDGGAAIHSENEPSDSEEGFTYDAPGGVAISHYNPSGSPTTNARRNDYSVRESDFYYGVSQRGPALSATPTRKLKTGPADPTSPMSNAVGWFRNIFTEIGRGNFTGRKKMDKGFQVVRSKPAIALMNLEGAEESAAGLSQPRYRDEVDLSSPAPAMIPAHDMHAHSRQSSRNATGTATHLATAAAAAAATSALEARAPSPYPDEEADLSYRPPGAIPVSIGASSSGEPDIDLLGPPTSLQGPVIPRRSSKRPKSGEVSYQPPSAISSRTAPELPKIASSHLPDAEQRGSNATPGKVSLMSGHSGSLTPTEFYRNPQKFSPEPSSSRRKRPPTPKVILQHPTKREKGSDRERESSRIPFVGGGSLTDRSVTPLSRGESFYSIPDSDPPSPPQHPVELLSSSSPSGSSKPRPHSQSHHPYHSRGSPQSLRPPQTLRHVSPTLGDFASHSFGGVDDGPDSRPLSTGTVSSFIAGQSITKLDDSDGKNDYWGRTSLPQSAEMINENGQNVQP